MTLSERLAEYVRACFTGLWIESHEQADALLHAPKLLSKRLPSVNRSRFISSPFIKNE